MTDLTILLNGNYIPWRPFNAEELAKLEKERAGFQRMAEHMPMKLNTKRQFFAYLLVTPDGGDVLTYTDLPEEYDELRVHWKGRDGSTYSMRIDHA